MEYKDWLPDAMQSINLFESNVLHWSPQDCYGWAEGETTKLGLRLEPTALDSFLRYTGYDLAKFGPQDFCQNLNSTYGSLLYESFRELMRAEGLEVHTNDGCCTTTTTTSTTGYCSAATDTTLTHCDNFGLLEDLDANLDGLQALDRHLHGVDTARTPDHQDEGEDGQLDDFELFPEIPTDELTEMLPANTSTHGIKEEESWPDDTYTRTNLPFLPSPSLSPSPFTLPILSPKSEDDDRSLPPTPPRDEDSADWLAYNPPFCPFHDASPASPAKPALAQAPPRLANSRPAPPSPRSPAQVQGGPLAPLQTPSRKRRRGPKNWEFIARLLADPKHNPRLVQWVDEAQGTFKLNKPGEIASMWGQRSTKKDSLTYDNFARGLRYHYTTGALSPVHERQLVYRCGPKMLQFLREEYRSRRRS